MSANLPHLSTVAYAEGVARGADAEATNARDRAALYRDRGEDLRANIWQAFADDYSRAARTAHGIAVFGARQGVAS